MSQSVRGPLGVTIISILALIAGIVLVVGGLPSLISGAFLLLILLKL